MVVSTKQAPSVAKTGPKTASRADETSPSPGKSEVSVTSTRVEFAQREQAEALLARVRSRGGLAEVVEGRLRFAPALEADELAQARAMREELIRLLAEEVERFERIERCCWCDSRELFDEEAGLRCGLCGKLAWVWWCDAAGEWRFTRGDYQEGLR